MVYNNKIVILAGGKGTRLQGLLQELPKPMIDINGKPLLAHLIEHSRKQGFNNYLLKTNYLSEKIENYFKDGKKLNVNIDYFIEDQPLGTAGGLKFLAKEKLPVIILYGDVYINFNLEKLLQYHIQINSQATLVVHKSNHPEDSDVVVLDDKLRVVDMIHKPGNKDYGNITNAAIYVLNSECFSEIEDSFCDFGKDILPKLIKLKYRVYGYKSDEYMKDIGTIKRYNEVIEDIKFKKIN